MPYSSFLDECISTTDNNSCSESSVESVGSSSDNTKQSNDDTSATKDGPPSCCWLNLPLGGKWIEVDSASFVADENISDVHCSSSPNSPVVSRALEREMPLHEYLPLAARECISSATSKTMYYARFGALELAAISGVAGFPKTSDFGTVGGYSYRCPVDYCSGDATINDSKMITVDRIHMVQNLPPFSSLTWLDRQLVSEWRTISGEDLKGLIEVQNTLLKRVKPIRSNNTTRCSATSNKAMNTSSKNGDAITLDLQQKKQQQQHQQLFSKSLDKDKSGHLHEEDDDDDDEYTRVRTLIPPPQARPKFAQSSKCYLCPSVSLHQQKHNTNNPSFSSVRRRHHCRLCGASICRVHGCYTHPLPELMYHPFLPERVCSICKVLLVKKDTLERIAWRLCRTRDYFAGSSSSAALLSPYFTPGLDTVSDAASRLTAITLTFSRKFPFGAQTTLAIETIDLIRKHGLNAIFGFLLRKEFIQATELLMKVVGIDRERWPISWKEMTLGIFYALAAEKYRRGARPEFEATIHRLQTVGCDSPNPAKEAETHQNKEEKHNTASGSDTSGENIIVNDIAIKKQLYPKTKEKNREMKKAEIACNVDDNDYYKESVGNDRLGENAAPGNSDSSQTLPIKSSLPFTNDEGVQPQPSGVCSPVSTPVISSCLLYAPLALSFLYAESEIDLQLLAAQQGWRLLYAHLRPLEYASREMSSDLGHFSATKKAGRSSYQTSNFNVEDFSDDGVLDKPAYAVLIHEQLRIACWGIRGTASVSDLVMDIRAIPIPFPDDNQVEDFSEEEEEEEEEDEGLQIRSDATGISDSWRVVPDASQGMAVCGMARAATNLFYENLPIMEEFWRKGYKIRITGHSLGGGIATLLGVLMTKHWKKHYGIEGGNVCKVYGFGTPACVDSVLSKVSSDFTTTVVLHDDVIPRLTPTSIRNLLKQLMLVKQTWVDQHFEQDLTSVFYRALKVWAPRFRGSFMLPRREIKTNIKESDKKDQQKTRQMIDFEEKFLKTDSYTDKESLLESSDEEVESAIQEQGFQLRCTKKRAKSSSNMHLPKCQFSPDFVLEDAPYDDIIDDPCSSENNAADLDGVDGADLLVLKETHLPRMYVPGRIVHIYSDNGAYKATFVPRSFKAIRRIIMAGNMLTDHTARAYYEALLEVKSVREASARGMHCPKWASYEESSACSCCASRFTWASTSDSEAQEARDKHNCRNCGQLVCDPCSRNRIALPKFGIDVPVRHCDRCYYNFSGIMRYIVNEN